MNLQSDQQGNTMTSTSDYLASPGALEDLRKLNARFIGNFIANDVASHEAMLHEQFLYIRGNGARVDRATYLEQWATGFDPDVIIYWDTRDELITVIGDVALVRATNKYVLRHATHEETGMAAYTDTYLYVNGAWTCIQAQITPVAEGYDPPGDTVISVYVHGVLQAGHG
jgi:hypothetical protein